MTDPGRGLTWARLLAVFLPLALYVGSLGNGFLIDDEIIVRSNIRLAADETPLQIFRRPEQFLDFTLPYYRPLTNLTYWLDSRLWGVRPGGFHLTNWLLHAAGTVLLFELVRRLAGGLAPAVVAAVLFAAHPIHTESVDMVQGRTDLLMTLALLASLLALREAVRAPRRALGMAMGCLSLLAFAAALLGKEMAVTWPALALAVMWADAEAGEVKSSRASMLLAGGLLALLGYFLLRWSLLGEFVPPAVLDSASTRLDLVAATLITYLTLLLWPFAFSFIRSVPDPSSWTDGRVVAGLLAAAALGAGFLLLRRRDRLAALGIGWLLVTLLPVLNLFRIPGFVVAERYLYLPSVGLCLLAAAAARWLAPRLHGSGWRTPVLAAPGALLLAFAVAIHLRTLEWREPIRVYEAMAAHSSGSFFVQTNLGLEYLHQGRLADAMTALTRARDLEPANPIAWNNLGVALAQSGRLPEARDAYRRAILLHPGYTQARENLGAVLQTLGKKPPTEEAGDKTGPPRAPAATPPAR